MCDDKKIIMLKYKDLKPLREKLYDGQGGICPILKQKIRLEDAVVDHKHMRKNDVIGENGNGLIRGVIHKNINVVEGKIGNTFKRYGIEKMGISLPDFLRNLADYLEQSPLPYIHPTEITRMNKGLNLLKKSSYNKLVKKHNNMGIRAKIPLYPKSKKITKVLLTMFKRCDLEPEFYKR